jgi:hypothetical protein
VVDTVTPPAPVILVGPFPKSPGQVGSNRAAFVFCDDADNDGDSGCDHDDLVAATLYCSLDTAAFTVCSSPKSYSSLAQGAHSFRVYAVDLAGNQGPTATWTWIVDTVKPATPVLTQTPGDPSPGPRVTFAWIDGSPDVAGYLCAYDWLLAFVPCSSSERFTVDTHFNRQHFFEVVGYDHAGNFSGPAVYRWKVGPIGGLGFSISGNTIAVLWPGASPLPIDLTFNNPNPGSLAIGALGVTIQSVSAPNASAQHPCSTTDFTATQYTGNFPLSVPAGSSNLESDGAAQNKWPTVRMVDNHADQNGCVGATVTLAYTGSARG